MVFLVESSDLNIQMKCEIEDNDKKLGVEVNHNYIKGNQY